jgi:hypothetical protein
MPIPTAFVEATDWAQLKTIIHGFGDSDNVSEDDLLAALQASEIWRTRFTESFTVEFRGEQILWHHYESLERFK